MVFATAGPAFADHNTIGARFAIGDPDPGIAETAGGDTSEDLRLIYHAGGSLPSPADQGTLPRASPPDQSGAGLGDWIGFIDGVIEHPGPAISKCATLDFFVFGTCGISDDPLYRVNSGDDDECDEATEKADLSRCDGNGHRVPIDFWPPVRLQNHKADVISDDTEDGSGFNIPGLYGYYVYLFGEGNGPAAGQGAFESLPANLCESIADGGLGHGTSSCNLITQEDINQTGHNDRWDGQRTAVCMYRPFFSTLSGGSDDLACPNISEFNQFATDSESTLYINNKPGWYQQTVSIDPFGSTLPWNNVPTMAGNQTDLANAFHYYVNPVKPPSHLFCASPPIASTGVAGLGTGIQLVQNEDNSWSHWETVDESAIYQVEAHDLDVYIADTTADEALNTAFDTVNTILDQVPDLPDEVQDLLDTVDSVVEIVDQTLEEAQNDLGNATGPLVDEVNEATDRAAPFAGGDPEPNSPVDNSWALTETVTNSEGCQDGLVLEETTSTFANRFTMGISAENVGTLHDYTYTNESEDGLPARASEQGYNPWNPDEYTFGGSILVVNDLDSDGNFDGCPPGDDPPGPGQDICAARLPFDVYNDDAVNQKEEKIGDIARNERFKDPVGLYFVLKVTGEVVIENNNAQQGTPADEQVSLPERSVLEGEGQHCVVGTSTGLSTDSRSAERFASVIGAASAEEADILQALCGDDPADASQMFIEDAFNDAPNAGGWSSAVSWIKVRPTPEGTHPDTGDGLETNYLVTVGTDLDSRTEGNLKLGSHASSAATVANVWDDGTVTYKWTDKELFDSEPREDFE